MNTYGKTPDQLTDACVVFVNLLKPYPMGEVIKAFGEYMRRHTVMPTPADIIAIIDPPAPTPDWAAFVSIKQRMQDSYQFVSDKDRQYVRWCEGYSSDKLASYEQRQQAKQSITEASRKLSYQPEDYD
jgi:hypothetical protein